MNNLGLIGSTGVIGKCLQEQFTFSHLYNSKNIDTLSDTLFDTVICAAPTSNRLWTAKNAQQDYDNISSLICVLNQIHTNTFILISTVDTQLHADTAYGRNRKYLEDAVKARFANCYVLRLGTIISDNITKNILFDLKNNTFLDSINLESTLQWTPLAQLKHDIEFVQTAHIREINLLSEPIQNKEIVDKFFRTTNSIGTNPGEAKFYNVTPAYYTKDIIFNAMAEFLK